MAIAALRYLLDTNILVAYVRGKALGDWIEATYRLKALPTAPLISMVVEGEIWSLARQLNWGEGKQRKLRTILGSFVSVPWNLPGLIEAYAEIDDTSRRMGRDMGKNDVWIAATARVTGAILLTTDKDFDHLDPKYLARHYIDPTSHL